MIGTRGSPLALAQARQVAQLLGSDRTVINAIKTTGDIILDRALSEAGGKGLFTKELDAALFDERAHLAVHSAKDLPTELPPGLIIAGCLPREDVRDAFISKHAKSLHDLPPGAIVGTASLRRQAQVLRLRPDLRITLLRGNVGTRLQRIEEGEIDATLLAMAGLNRLGLAEQATAPIDLGTMLPAIGQGAIAIVVREQDHAIREAIGAFTHTPTGIALEVERAFLRVLDGSCRTPIAGLATVEADKISFRGLLLSEDGREVVAVERFGNIDDAQAIGDDAGQEVVSRANPALLPHLKRDKA